MMSLKSRNLSVSMRKKRERNESSIWSDIVCIQWEIKENIPEGIIAFRYNNHSCGKICSGFPFLNYFLGKAFFCVFLLSAIPTRLFKYSYCNLM